MAVMLGAFVVFTVVSALVGDLTGSSAHDHHGWVLVIANVIILGIAAIVARIALLSWRRAKSG